MTYMSSCDNLILSLPKQAGKRQQTRANVNHSPGRLLRSRRIHNRHTAVMARKCQGIATRRKRTRLNPSRGIIQKLSADGIKRQPLTPRTGLRALINALDIPGEHSAVRIRRSSSQQDGVGVPRQSRDGAADWLLQVLGDPPVVFLLEVANRDDAGAGAHGEFLLRGRPTDEGGSTVDAEENEGGLPASGGLFPDVGIAVCSWGLLAGCTVPTMGVHTLRAGDDLPTSRRDIHAGDSLIVSLELVGQCVLVPRLLI